MKHSSICTRSIAAVVALSFAAYHVTAQTTATTTPVGFITTTIPAAADANNPSNATFSVPLYVTAAFTSAVSAVNDGLQQVTLSSAAFIASPAAGSFAVNATLPMVGIQNPHLLRIKSGSNPGRFFAISANGTNNVTVILPASVATLSSVLSVGDSCEIVPANTIGSVFGSVASPPVLASGTAPGNADNVLLWNGVTFQTFFWTGAIWKRTGTTDQSNVIIYPDDGVFVTRRSTSGPALLTVMGTVPSTVEKSDIDASTSTFLANRFPVSTTLGNLGLQNIPGWVAGSTSTPGQPGSADTVQVWNGVTWQVFYWTGLIGTPNNIWKRTGTTDQGPLVNIPVGTGVFITHNGALLTLNQNLPYTP